MFTTVDDAIYWIEHIERFSKRENLDRMKLALSMLNNPELCYKKIHVAGTNGKGSTVSFIKNILLEDNYRVGAFISPYVVKFNERIELNYSYISDEDLIYYSNMIYNLFLELEKKNEHLTFFEVLTLIALKYFADKHVDYAVIEVGLGGLNDATNAIYSDVSLITNIGFDHMKQLGNTLEEIALNKLGIVKPGNMLITTVKEELKPLFEKYTTEKKASMKWINIDNIFIYNCEFTSFIYDDKPIDLSVIGLHQAYNATLAIETIKYLIDDFPFKKIKEGLLNTTWPGRMEIVGYNPKVILDGAHNIHGHEALALSMKKIYFDKKIHVIFSALKDKETKKMIDKVSEYAEDIIFTDFDYYRVKDAKSLALETNKKSEIITPYDKCINDVISRTKKDEIILITGSLYFISNVRKLLKGK